MDYKKKLKYRLITSIVILIIGLGMIVTAHFTKNENSHLFTLGFAFVVISIARIKRYFFITKNEKLMKQQEIAENDERNQMITSKAKSISFYIYVILTSVGIIVLQVLNQSMIAFYLSVSLGIMLAIYWICYLIIRRKY